MKMLIQAGLLIFLINFATACNGQTNNDRQPLQSDRSQRIGGDCDDCEMMYVGMPKQINSIDTSSGWTEKGQKFLLKGTVYRMDGKTPAPNVIIYYWQTDNDGYYSPGNGMEEAAKRHGHIRGWLKTDDKGHYSLFTIRPSPYPNGDIPAHIHTLIKEPDLGNEYHIDEFVFDDDPLLTAAIRKGLENRGGSGILKIKNSGTLQIAEHDIILGLNIPNYPATGPK